ncbi:ABC transporter permease, partial [Pseudoalteromonas marina]
MFKSAIAIMEGTKAALMAIKANAMRSALTCLGIIIGVAAVITVVAVMQGFTKQINDQLADMAPDVTSIKPFTSIEQEMVGKNAKLTYSDFLTLKARIKEAETLTALMFTWRFSGGAEYGNKSHSSRVMGTEQDYQKAYRTFPELGRFIRAEDDEKRRRVAFIGPSIIEKLNLPDNPVGEYIKLGGEWFRIIGVAEKQGSLFGFDQDDYINIPISTMSALEGASSTSNVQIMFRLKEGVDEELTLAKITRILRQLHKLKDGEENDFEFETA